MDALTHQQCPRCEGAIPHGAYVEEDTGLGRLLVRAHCAFCGIVLEASVLPGARAVVACSVIDRARNRALYLRALRALERTARRLARDAA